MIRICSNTLQILLIVFICVDYNCYRDSVFLGYSDLTCKQSANTHKARSCFSGEVKARIWFSGEVAMLRLKGWYKRLVPGYLEVSRPDYIFRYNLTGFELFRLNSSTFHSRLRSRLKFEVSTFFVN